MFVFLYKFSVTMVTSTELLALQLRLLEVVICEEVCFPVSCQVTCVFMLGLACFIKETRPSRLSVHTCYYVYTCVVTTH